ncbi:MAG: hypothetical protein PHW73_10365 [Atribacterota bacterium]|nr:hypothetical protein [Atribacterota bacterium]
MEYKPFESCVQPYKVVLYRFIYEDGKWEFYPSSGWMFTGKEVKKILKMANDLEKGKFDFGRDKEKFESIKKLSKYLDCEKEGLR